MNEYSILFAIGKDKPGIVQDVSRILISGGANIEDSRMAVMGGRFTVTVLFACLSDQLADIKAQLPQMEEQGLSVTLYEAENPKSLSHKAALPLKLKVKAMDHPGIVNLIVGMLNKHNTNVESLDTRIENAPFSGEPIFNLHLLASVPANESVTRLKNELNEMAANEYLDLTYPE